MTGAASEQVRASGRLTAAEAAEVLRLVGQAAAEDGVDPLSEHVMLHLRYGGDPRARNVLLFSGGRLAGYAHLDPTDPVQGPSGELVIGPEHRRRGLGLQLAQALAEQAGDQPLRLWAHGDLPAAGALAAAAGYTRVRALWQMRRSLTGPLDPPRLPEGITLRTFRVGQDEQAWTELNAKAFAGHPEQGAWTRQDLELREREPWFDPSGFLLAERDSRLAGFHWTKVHGGQDEGGLDPGGHDPGGPDHRGGPDPGGPDGGGRHQHQAIGEVYVVGVHPQERGTGLGRALTVAGLRYLRSRGLRQAMLYVDETNLPAIKLYESLGFTHAGTDVMFAGNRG